MAVEIKVPSVGESITEGTLARWLKPDGAFVHTNDPLFELETEKATTEVVSPVDGRLVITVPEGRTVPMGTVVGRIEEAPVENKAPEEASQGNGHQQLPANRPAAPPPVMPAPPVPQEDVSLALAEPPDQEKATSIAPRETRQRMSAIRERIIERLVSAQHTTATVTTFNEANLSAVMALRQQYREAFQKKHATNLGLMSFFVKASVEALKAFPRLNARIDGSDIVLQHFHHIGVAVSTDKGLMVPVVRDAGLLSFAGIEKRIAALSEKARSGTITVDDLLGGTFTITNGGVFGSLLSTPILNSPQSAILGMHAIQKRPVAVNDQVVIRPMMYLALSYDHRIVDGQEAVGFLVRIKECIEQPERMLLEV